LRRAAKHEKSIGKIWYRGKRRRRTQSFFNNGNRSKGGTYIPVALKWGVKNPKIEGRTAAGEELAAHLMEKERDLQERSTLLGTPNTDGLYFFEGTKKKNFRNSLIRR